LTDSKIKIYDRSFEPFGKTWEYWTQRFWQWLVSIPTNENPANDDTGQFCDKNQNGPVWFLTGTAAGVLSREWRLGLDVVQRKCNIPSGKAILAAVETCEVSLAEFHNFTEQDLIDYVKTNNVSSMDASIDGIKLQRADLEKYRVQTELFELDMVKNNIFEASAGPTQAASDGYFLFLEPPTISNFTIHFAQTTEQNQTLDTQRFAYDVTYNINIS
jgi:hypothetical protein